MNLPTKSKFLKLLEQEIIKADKRFDFEEVELCIGIIENDLGFKIQAKELREEYL